MIRKVIASTLGLLTVVAVGLLAGCRLLTIN